MSAPSRPLMRPDDADAFRRALRLAKARTGVSLAFGGLTSNEQLVLDEFFGSHSNELRGLRIDPGRGVGGYVLANQHPQAVNDYGSAQVITHDYDVPVGREGLRAMVGVPVVVGKSVRGVIYAAVRSVFPLGDSATGALMGVARELAVELAIRDEVDRRIELLGGAIPAARGSELSDLHDEMRQIASEVADDDLRTRLLSACRRLEVSTGRPPDDRRPTLSPRELDVLAEVALGCTNAEIAQRLSLLPETVKSYLRSASRKLGASGRYRAVLAAQRLGLLGTDHLAAAESAVAL